MKSLLLIVFYNAIVLIFASNLLAATNIPDIYRSQEAAIFFGKYDALSAPSRWEGRMWQWAKDTCNESINSRDWRHETEPWLPGESRFDRSLTLPGSDLFDLTGGDLVTERQNNVYTRASAVYEEIFFQRIASMPEQSMEPKDVLRLALQVTNGNYGLAVLTAHFVLKATAYEGRATMISLNRTRKELLYYISQHPNGRNIPAALQRYQAEYRHGIARLQQFNKVVRPLKSLRADPSRIRDKMGPWYHIFALFAIDAYGGAQQARMAAGAEHGAKSAKFFIGEGGFEYEKARIDMLFVNNQSQCRRSLPNSLQEAYDDTIGTTYKTTHACSDSSVPATKRALFYRRIYGGGETSYPVKEGKYICFSNGYTLVTPQTITKYQCQSKKYQQCKVTEEIKVDDVIHKNDGAVTYKYKKGEHWVTLKPAK